VAGHHQRDQRTHGDCFGGAEGGGGTHLTYGYLKQFPVLPPNRYSEADLAFLVPRVLELT
jgi:hypothetical protein